MLYPLSYTDLRFALYNMRQSALKYDWSGELADAALLAFLGGLQDFGCRMKEAGRGLVSEHFEA